MADDSPLMTRTVVCPRCYADAILTYSAACDGSEPPHAHNVVYLCPNSCPFPQDRFSGLLGRDG